VRYREAAKKLRRLGCEELARRGRGSHRVWLNPKARRVAPLPDWGSKDLSRWTPRDAVRHLGIEWSDFEDAQP
jgi:predicted RNA binding protein YcfA (HicA-like mRNA interferase family)